MVVGLTSHVFQRVIATDIYRQSKKFRNTEMRSSIPLSSTLFPSIADRQQCWGHRVLASSYRPMLYKAQRYRAKGFRSFAFRPISLHELPLAQETSLALTRSYDALLTNPATPFVIPAIGIIVFDLWGFLPLMRDIRNRFDVHRGNNWKKSRTYFVSTSYLQPLLLWIGVTLICRGLDPVVLPSVAGHAIKTRLITFVRLLSAVLIISYIFASLIRQVQKFLVDMCNPNDTRNMGFDFTFRALYTGVWIAAISLFMELLGFNTQKWITAGGFGTVFLTLAGREIFTNFLSSVMINATRPFVVHEMVDAKIDGVEISGVVEESIYQHVGWWSATVIRGDDGEAIYIPNHKLTVSILRNSSRRTHRRIKTYLAISHMDAGKIGIIVADMRKVLAKNPQIEQQRLHRRVFLEKIDPKNQALTIYISCFVKTVHCDEYLNVQEGVMLDLLRIVAHHKARLATQIRTVQKSYGNADFDNIPFGEDMYSRARGRPLLIDASARISDGKSKPRPASSREEHKVKTNGSSSVQSKSASPESVSLSNSEKQDQKKLVPEDGRTKRKNDNATPAATSLAPVTSTSKSGKGKNHEPEATEHRGDGSVSVNGQPKERI
ncbi:hypothetical protein ACP4OV_015997 [Aristida adscensionis]